VTYKGVLGGERKREGEGEGERERERERDHCRVMYVRAGLIIPSPKRRKYTGARPPTAEMLLLIDPVSFRLFSSRARLYF